MPLGSPEALVEQVDMMRAHAWNGVLFAKPLREYGGRGVVRIGADLDTAALWENVQETDYLFQEGVAQHPTLNALHPSSLNTLRITKGLLDGQVQPACVRLRIGQGGAFVDNGGGGFYGRVDLERGRVVGRGVSSFANGGRLYAQHPDTGVVLDGCEVPYFAEAVEMACAAARYMPYPLVGWDVAVSADGPVLIEGNHNPDYHADERASGGYLANPVIRALIDELSGKAGL